MILFSSPRFLFDRNTAARRLTALGAHPLFAYATIVLLQWRVMRGIWKYRDMSTGDECFWFTTAWHWLHGRQVDIAWSPIYSVFYGAILGVTRDAAEAMFLHRLVIAASATVMVLAVMRRLLPAPAAWVVAAWWALLPINFDTMYEVHLFALMPLLLCWWMVLVGNAPWHRGAGLGILLVDALLIRNETIVTAAAFAGVCAVWEMRRKGRQECLPHKGDRNFCPTRPRSLALPNARSLALPYALPIIMTIGLAAAFYARSSKKFPELGPYYGLKHSVNIAQAYAAGYKQRHPEWPGDRWTQYGELCQRDFGTPTPSLVMMLTRNPRALAEHVLWNASLVPNGLELMLFNGVAGTRDPDYRGLFLRQSFPIPLIAATLLIVVAGSIQLRRQWRTWIGPQAIGWLAMACAVPTAILVMLIERPRPSYLFGLTLFVMAVVGLCGAALVDRWRWTERLAPLMAPLMLLAALLVPSYYKLVSYGQPVLESYERLRPFESLLSRPGAVFVGAYPQAVQAFVGQGAPDCFDCSIFEQRPGQMGLADFLNARNITVLELDPAEHVGLQLLQPQVLSEFPATARKNEWHLVASQQLPQGQWMLFARTGRFGPIIMQEHASDQ
ncbi:MAG TPA: hypothetical protein VK797_28985 [Tepidisphaeraceae bacterium]|nr:hypothetical protein [Tepidisphaeraceae bacterium]